MLFHNAECLVFACVDGEKPGESIITKLHIAAFIASYFTCQYVIFFSD
jgi:hypothetical protein